MPNIDKCRECEKQIIPFLNNELDDNSFLEFRKHVCTCPACKEEYTIQYFVKVGLDVTDVPDNMDLLSNLDTMIENRFVSIINKRTRRFGIGILGVGLIIFLILFILF